MPVVISDEVLEKAGLTEQEARVELACRLFDIGKLALWPAARLAGMSRVEFEGALASREISICRPTLEDLEKDVATLKRLGRLP
jgi:predicted HTH domain antitoxin